MLQLEFNKASWVQMADGFALQLFVKNKSAAIEFIRKMVTEKTYVAELKQLFKKRSTDANAYCWVLLSKIAEALTAEAQGDIAYTKDDIYIDMLKKYGQSFIVKVPNVSVEMFKRQYKYVEQHESLPMEERAQYFKVLLGSSTYDTKEMYLLLNGIIATCKELGIDTATPAQITQIMDDWMASREHSTD